MIGMGIFYRLTTRLGSVDPPHPVGQIVGLLAKGRIIPVEQFTRMRIKRIHHLTVNVLLDPFQIAVKWCIALTLNAPYLLCFRIKLLACKPEREACIAFFAGYTVWGIGEGFQCVSGMVRYGRYGAQSVLVGINLTSNIITHRTQCIQCVINHQEGFIHGTR